MSLPTSRQGVVRPDPVVAKDLSSAGAYEEPTEVLETAPDVRQRLGLKLDF